MKNLMMKLSSRKLWLAIIGASAGVYVMLGGDPNAASRMVGGVIAIIPIVSFIAAEGKIDAERVKGLVESGSVIANAMKGAENDDEDF